VRFPRIREVEMAAGSVRSARWVALAGILLLVAGLLALPLFAEAQSEQPGTGPSSTLAADDARIERTPAEVNRLAMQLQVRFMSPYCPGMSLRDCTSGKAAVLRDEIHGWVAEGRSEKWIEDQLVARFGESILSAPRFRGFNALVWIFPVLAVIIGLGLIFSYLQRQNRLQLAKQVPGRDVRPDYRPNPEIERRLEEEVSARIR
jgi:cytochrome c-type biogenesis protein CcmH